MRGGVQQRADPREDHGELVTIILITIKPAPLLSFPRHYCRRKQLRTVIVWEKVLANAKSIQALLMKTATQNLSIRGTENPLDDLTAC